MHLPIKTVKNIDAIELEQFIEYIYGINVSISASYEKSSGSYIDMVVEELNDQWEYGEKELAEWKQEESSLVDLEVIMWDLVRRKLIPTGEYLITVWW